MKAIPMNCSSSSSVVWFPPNREPKLTRLSSSIFSWLNKPSGGSGPRRLVVASANRRKKTDSHSFVPKPDEATGPFPEAVLLKKKITKDDGRVAPDFADAEEEELYEFLQLQLESDLNLERIRHYEVVYLIHEDHIEEVDVIVSKVQDFIREKKGRIWRLNNWGLRRLAYKIQKASKANFILMNFEIEAKWINDFKTMLDKDERIIRHLVMKQDKAITEDCPPPPEFYSIKEAQGMDDDDDDGDDDEEEEEEEEEEEDGEDQNWLVNVDPGTEADVEDDEGDDVYVDGNGDDFGIDSEVISAGKLKEKVAR